VHSFTHSEATMSQTREF